MKLCLSVSPHTDEEAVNMLRKQRKTADLVELRVDRLQKPDFRKILRGRRPPVIITNRIREEGGAFWGTEDEAMRIFSEARLNGAEFIDVELRWGAQFIQALQKLKSSTKIILSHHNFADSPTDISAVYTTARRFRASVIKIVWMAGSFRDNDMVFELYERAKRDRQPLIAIAMGPFGQVSRILPGCQNAFLTYGVQTNGSITAPGQFTAADLDKLYRVRNLNRRTKIFGLLGNPVAQSRGVYFHNGVFRKKNIDAVYVNFLIDDLAHFFHRHAHRLTGASVTMPFKSDVLHYLDTISDDCRQLSAVNTIIKRRGLLSGSNTDYLAIMKILRTKTSVKGREVVVMGTGATATTMAFAARELGGKVRILGRNPEKARSLAERFNLQWAPLDNMANVSCDLLLNAIPTQPSPIVPGKFLRSGMTVFDAVYQPPVTPLLQSALAAGCKIISGLELFTNQARMQSRLFLEAAS